MVIKFCSFSLLCLSRKNAVPLEDRGCKGCQNPRPPVSKAKTHTKAETGKQSENSASPNSRVLCLCKEKPVSLTNQGCKGCQNEALCHKKGLGGPGVLWHIKIRYLPNAVSQSLRIQLALNSLIRTPVSLAEKHSKAKTGKLSPEFGFAEFLSFVPLQRKTQFL